MRTYLAWSERFRVGVPELNDDHRALVQLINEACDAWHRNGRDELVAKLEALEALANAHFSREEAIMRGLTEYGHLRSHADEHRNRLKQLQRLTSDLRQSEVNGNEISLENELIDWFVKQSIGYDSAIKAYFDDSR